MSIYQSQKVLEMRGGATVFGWQHPRWNPDARMIEAHPLFSNYMGPFSDVKRRWVDEKLRGTNAVDEASRIHDINYSNLSVLKAQNRISQQQLERGIRNSDNKLTNVAKSKLLSVRPFEGASAAIAYAGIKAKLGLQDLNVLSKTAFVSAKSNRPYMSETKPETVNTIPADYLQGGAKKKDRLAKLKKSLKK